MFKSLKKLLYYNISMGNYISFNKNNENINLNQVPYNCLTNFENVTEKACIKADKQNDKIYKKLLESVKSAEKHVKDTGLYFNLEVPLPPHPSDRDKFLLWQKRNVNHHVITQSEAVVFLEQNGFKLNIDYEPYQAIELSLKKLKNKKVFLLIMMKYYNQKILIMFILTMIQIFLEEDQCMVEINF